jgi:hypothetical protein
MEGSQSRVSSILVLEFLQFGSGISPSTVVMHVKISYFLQSEFQGPVGGSCWTDVK